MNPHRQRPVFVFGSNLAGMHGAGAALAAKLYHAAQPGVGVGRTGNAYAIPTKNERLKPLPILSIYMYVEKFIKYARNNPELTFEITPIGTGLAGFKHHQIAPMFQDAPSNCMMPKVWDRLLGAKKLKERER